MKVRAQVFSGMGSERGVIWKGLLQHIPRVGDEIVIGDDVHEVQRLRWSMPIVGGQHEEVEIHVR